MISALYSTVRNVVYGLDSDRQDITKMDPSRYAFQYMSDLHLELCSQYTTFEFQPTAPYLILAGDIGYLNDPRLEEFLAAQTRCFEKVFFVPGNHEFYGATYAEGMRLARAMAGRLGSNFVLLQQDRTILTLPNSLLSSSSVGSSPKRRIHVLGCSLWSHVPLESSEAVRARIPDFNKIEDWSVEAHNHLHRSDLAWLRGELTALVPTLKPQDRVLVITHHAPIAAGSSAPDKTGSPISCAFSSDLLKSGLDAKGVTAWIYGHTHYSNSITQGNTTLLANQRGHVFPENDDGFERSSRRHAPDPEHRFDPERTIWL
ncbi:hypothetical protein CFIMG_007936RA00001 [Ceratocystis fimbriata CBS 114723]|uniref:Calcineurin-like phosphoesterase domain-containing protein n=1 Tax=Ceratocystis fimbriata CBS 114723 TaxID=1035309 RepID=A0A2C5X3M0_9PEZI|nr:hypothetical protein CFIMG_007936RA00001 [Ceratocystis fimbriata CBS 114723]